MIFYRENMLEAILFTLEKNNSYLNINDLFFKINKIIIKNFNNINILKFQYLVTMKNINTIKTKNKIISIKNNIVFLQNKIYTDDNIINNKIFSIENNPDSIKSIICDINHNYKCYNKINKKIIFEELNKLINN